MDGLSLKFTRSPLESTFTMDEFGALIPAREHLQMGKVTDMVSRQLKADTGLYRRLTDTYYRTDVEFTDNPFGNTPTLGVGIKLYGKRPLDIGFRERIDIHSTPDPAIAKQIEKRERKIVTDQKEYMSLHKSLKPTRDDTTEYVQWLVEGDQVMTGGGFDGNHIGEVHKSALKFIKKGDTHVEFGSNRFSQLCVEGSLWLRDQLEAAGLKRGSLKPVGCSEVRMEQDNDGMIGWPVYSKGWADLDQDIALRLLIDSGVDTRHLVGSQVVDPRTGQVGNFKVVNALAHVLDRTVVSDPSDLPSIVTLLARIQKHGWKEEQGEIVPKKSKTRSVYPNAARAGMVEAMVGTPLIKELQRLKCPFMPSLLDKPNRVQIIKNLITKGHAENYEFLSLDESQYDATVIGGALATMMYYAIRPFYNAAYYNWVDFAIYALVYKYLLLDTSLAQLNTDEYKDAISTGIYTESKPFTIFGMTDGLISGAKLTHVGGSFYGGVVIHYVMPKYMNFEPLLGVQAGDDCVWAYPRDRVDYTSMENTYRPVEEAAKSVGIEINALKQIWFVVKSELVNIFLQDVYHEATETWGTGSIFRPLTAVFFSERNKGLSIGEQYMAEIARMNQGADSAFAASGVQTWLSKEEFLGVLFKDRGVNAFRVIVDSVGDSLDEIAQRIDVGSFSYGVSKEDMKNGSLPILPIIADVASQMTFTKSAAQALKSLGEVGIEGSSTVDQEPIEGPDIGDSDDVLAD